MKQRVEREHVSYRLPTDVLSDLADAAARTGSSQTKLVELCIRRGLPKLVAFMAAPERPEPKQLDLFE